MTTTTSAEPAAPAARPSEAGAPTAKKAKSTRAYLVLAAIVALGAVVYLVFAALTRGHESTDDAQVEADVVPISARVGGTVLKVLVADNTPVKKGQPLIEIDSAELEAKVAETAAQLEASRAQAEASDAQLAIVAATSKGGLSAARAQLSGSATSVASADAQIAAAKAALARAQAEDARAQDDLNRAESLKKDQAIPQAQVDSARANAAAARAAVAQAQAQLGVADEMKRTAQTHVSESQAHVEASAPVDAQLAQAKANADLAHARVAATDATLAQMKLQLGYTHIIAPADGVLSRLAAREGQLLQPGQQVVALVPHATYLTANFKETQVGDMKAGQRATIEVDAFPGRKFEGTVESTSPGTGARFSLLPPDNASGNFVKVVQRVPVKIGWSNLPADVHVAAGMSADVTVYTR